MYDNITWLAENTDSVNFMSVTAIVSVAPQMKLRKCAGIFNSYGKPSSTLTPGPNSVVQAKSTQAHICNITPR